MRQTHPAFTITELLVVLGIITVLLAVLTPALEKAAHTAEVVFCASNEHAIGRSVALWLNDHKHTYPVILNFGTLVGNLGTSRQYGSDKADARIRPLNVYLGYDDEPVRVAECPADVGDPLSYDDQTWTPTQSAYDGYGTSYIEAYANAKWGVKPLFGQMADPKFSAVMTAPQVQRVRSHQVTRPQNKIVLGDWPFYGDRKLDKERTQWHNNKVRQMNILFGDLRVEFYVFPNQEMEKESNASRVPDPGFYWW